MEVTSISYEEYQRNAWISMKNSINQKIGEINVSNLSEVSRKLYLTNIYRGRGVLVRAAIEAQEKDLPLTPVYAALFAGVNMVFPIIGDLLVRRLICRYQQGQKMNSLELKSFPTLFLSYLLHHNMINESLMCQIIVDLFMNPTNKNIQLIVITLTICGTKLNTDHKEELLRILMYYKTTLQFDTQTEFMIDAYIASYCNNNQDNASRVFEKKFQIPHTYYLSVEVDPENFLDEFVYDPNFRDTELHYLDQINIIFTYNDQKKKEEEERKILKKYQYSRLSKIRRRLFV